jgi:hypothetical protein
LTKYFEREKIIKMPSRIPIIKKYNRKKRAE